MKTRPQRENLVLPRKVRSSHTEEPESISILLADDHPVVVQGLAAIIATEANLKIVGQAYDGETTCALHAKLKPDVLLLDLRMPDSDGLDVVKRIIAQDQAARILIMTTYDLDECVWRCLKAGAKGYLLKDATQAEIVKAIRAVASGLAFITPDLALKLAQRAATPELTPRENDVLQLLALGKSNKEIAHALSIGEGTVKSHMKCLFNKLGASSRSEAIGLANKRGFIRLP
jgi:two-component system NarL family response regulator